MKLPKQIQDEFNDYLTSALEKRWASYRLLRSKNQLDLSHLKCESTL
jgi:hypothetical protein